MGFGSAVVAALAAYIAVLAVLGIRARAARASESLADFYLAGRGLGGVVLLFTLYATQYSGNTLVGYPGEAYRVGFPWVMSVGFMLAIVVVYLVVAPRLRAASERHRFVTPADWLDQRFGNPALTRVTNLLMAVAIANYLLAQLMAMGHVVAGLSDGAIPYAAGVLVLTAAILGYELLGGLRAVAWTDCLQGILLAIGLFGLLAATMFSGEGIAEATAWVLENQPAKGLRPDATTQATWASTILLIGFSGAVYPQAIQRIFAARSSTSLRKALSVLAFLPFLTTLPVFLVGILALPRLSGLTGVAADQVLPALLRGWAAESEWMFWMCILTVVGVVAAIMSTADSVLLTLSSMLAKDFVAPVLGRRGAPRGRSPHHPHREGLLARHHGGAGGDRPHPADQPLGTSGTQDGTAGAGGARLRAGADLAAALGPRRARRRRLRHPPRRRAHARRLREGRRHPRRPVGRAAERRRRGPRFARGPPLSRSRTSARRGQNYLTEGWSGRAGVPETAPVLR